MTSNDGELLCLTLDLGRCRGGYGDEWERETHRGMVAREGPDAVEEVRRSGRRRKRESEGGAVAEGRGRASGLGAWTCRPVGGGGGRERER